MRLFVKNMVCDRCIAAVRSVLEQAGIRDAQVRLGMAEFPGESVDADLEARIAAGLNARGFELIFDRDLQLVEQIKTAVIEYARAENERNVKLSVYLADRIGMDYTTMSRIFSAREQRTIENYLITQKIEFVKELLEYGELTLSEIAWRAGYSSVAHLSRQFRQVTGLTASEYRRSAAGRSALDRI